MAIELDGLSYKVTADTTSAVSALERLATTIEKFKATASGFGGNEISKELRKIGTAIDKTDANKAKSLASALNALSKASKTQGNVGDKLKSINSALKSMDPNGAKSLVTMLRTLNKSMGTENLTDKLWDLSGGVEMLGDATQKIDATKADSLSKVLAAINRGEIKEFHLPERIEATANALNNITDEAIERIERLADAVEKFKGVKLSSIYGKAGANLVDKTDPNKVKFGKPTGWGDFGTVGHWLDVDEDNMRGLYSTILGTNAQLQIFMGLFGKLKGILIDTATDVGFFAKKIALLPMAIGQRTISQVKAFTSSLGGLIHTVTRIALIKGIRGLITSVTKSLQDGTNALYNYSAAMGGTFAASMDSLATSANYLSNSFAAMTAPIYNSLAPALDALVDKIVVLLNWINQLFAALSGAKTYTIAKKTATTFGDVGNAANKSGGAAKKATKELKRFILAFDEINALGSQNDGSGSGGSGGGSGSGGLGDYAFEDLAINSAITDFVDALKEKISAGDWEGLGRELGFRFNHLVYSIDWGGLGTKLGEGIDAVIQTLYYTLKTADFFLLGEYIALFINNAISSVDWEVAGRLLVRCFTAMWDLALGFFSNLDYEEVGKSIGEFLSGVAKELTEWLESYNWEQRAEYMVRRIAEFFEGLAESDLASSIFAFLKRALITAVQLLVGIISGLCTIIVEKFKTWFNEQETGASIFKALFALSGGVAKWVFDNVIDPIITAFLGETWEKLKEVGIKIGEKIKAGIMSILPQWLIDKLEGSNKAGEGNVVGASLYGVMPTLINGLNKAAKKMQEAAETFSEGTTTLNATVDPSFADAEQRYIGIQNDTVTKTFLGDQTTGFREGANLYMLLQNKQIELEFLVNKSPGMDEDINEYKGLQSKHLLLELEGKMNDSEISKIKSSISGVSGKDVTVTLKGSIAQSFKDAKKARDDIGDKSVSVTISGSWKGLSNAIAAANDALNKLANKAGGINIGNKKAMGGAYYGGGWHNIPQYAGGTTNAGSIFIAGERGPELVGHIGGRTEVLNASQLAATMFSATIAAVAQLGPALGVINENIVAGANGIIAAQLYNDPEDTTASVVEGVRAGMYEASMSQNELLREQNDLLRALLEKENTVEITTNSLTSAFNRTNQRNGRTIIPVG